MRFAILILLVFASCGNNSQEDDRSEYLARASSTFKQQAISFRILEDATSLLERRIDSLYANGKLVDSLFQVSQSFRGEFTVLMVQLSEARSKIVSNCEHVSETEADTLSLRYFQFPRDIVNPEKVMLGDDMRNVSGFEASNLKRELVVLHDKTKVLDPRNRNATLNELIPKELYDEKMDKMISWEWYNFYHKDEVAVLFQLKQIGLTALAARNAVDVMVLSKAQ